MPITPTYPGVDIEEIPSSVRTITGVATSITAFVGRTLRGPENEPVTVNSFADFERIFGRLGDESTVGYAVRDFYLNRGSQAIVVRLFHPSFATDAERQTTLGQARTQAQTGADAMATAARDAAGPRHRPVPRSGRHGGERGDARRSA
jgi:phage tail sheath protein FI